MSDLNFDVTANSDAASTFLADAAAARAFAAQLDRLDGRQIRVRVTLDAASQAPIQAFSKQLDGLDRRTARARVDLDGAEQATARSAAFEAVLRRLPNAVRTRVELELDRSAPERIAAVVNGVGRLGTVTQQVASGVSRFREITRNIVDPASIPVIERVSDAIAGRFHAAVEVTRGGVDRLSTGLAGLRNGLIGLGVANNAAGVIAGIGGAIVELSGAALLAPAALGAVGVAVITAKLALLGFDDALTGSAKKQREAFAKMGPEAQKLVTTLKSLGPAANEFRQAIQDTAVKGLSEQVRGLASTYLPVLKTGLTGVATGLNGMAVGAAKAVQSTTAIGGVRTIIDATAKATGNMRDSVGNAVLGFLNLGAAGSKYIPGIGTAIDNAATKFRAWTMAVTSSGQFDLWVQRARTGFQQLGTIAGNVGSIVLTVFRAMDQNGAGLLTTLVTVTTQLRTFLQSAQGNAALQAFAQTLAAAGAALSNVFGAALRAAAPLLITLAPLVQLLATAIGDHLVTVINLAAPLLQRLAQAAAANPETFLAIAKAATAVAIGFGPMVAIIGVAATVLKSLLLASLVGAAMAQLGLAGTAVHRVMLALVSPMALIREALPLIARGAGALAAAFLQFMGPVGYLIIAFATLYATSEQFRIAFDGVAKTVGGLFMQTLQQAGEIIANLVTRIGDVVTAVSSAAASVVNLGAVFGPAGGAISTVLTTIFGVLGKLPGAALAAFAAFIVLGKIAPLFTAASAAAAGFAARMLAFQSASTIATAATNAAGNAANRFSTVLSKMGSALPLIGVALIGISAALDEWGDKSDDIAKRVVGGQLSIAAAMKASDAAVEHSYLFWFSATQQQEAHAAGRERVTAAIQEQLAVMAPMQRLEAEVAIAQQNLNDAIVEFGAGSPQATAAAGQLAEAQGRLAEAQKDAETATKSHTDAVRDAMNAQFEAANASLAYESAVRRLEDAQQAAATAEKEHGKSSREYKEASDEVVRASLDVAAAAGKRAQAEAEAAGRSDAAAVGAQAQTQTLLSLAAAASGPARDALLKVAQGMNQAELDAISSANAASGLKTQILTLPNGKKITVLVDPTQAVSGFEQVKKAADAAPKDLKLRVEAPTAQVQEQLKAIGVTITQIPGTKDVELSVKDDLGRARLTAFLATIQTATAAPQLDLNTATGQEKANAFKTYIDGLTGVAKADADTTPGTGKAAQMKADIDAITAIMKADADISPGTAKGAELQSHISSLIGIMTADANNAPGTAKGDALRGYISSLIGIMEARANTDPATAEGRAAKSYIDGLKALLQADANTGPARSALNALVAEWNGRSIYVNIGGNRVTAGGGVIGYAGGGLAGYAGGGMARTPSRSRGLVNSGYAPGVDSQLTWTSPGESVLVPELTRLLGGRRILAANAEASGGRPATVVGQVASLMDGLIGRTTAPAPVNLRVTAAAAGPRAVGGPTTIVQPANNTPLVAEMKALRGELADAVSRMRPINVTATRGSETETARTIQLANR